MNGRTVTLALGLALLTAGAVLLWWGYEESRSLEGQISQFFTGTAPDRVLWKYVAGGVSAVIGLVLVLRK